MKHRIINSHIVAAITVSISAIAGIGRIISDNPSLQKEWQPSKKSAKVNDVGEPTEINHEINVASVSDSDYQKAATALERAGIPFASGGDLGMTGINVSEGDFDKAKKILRTDSQQHNYTISLANHP